MATPTFRLPDGLQSVFSARSADAAAILDLTWVLFGGGGLVLVLVTALVWIAIRRSPRWLASERSILLGGVAFPTVVVFALLLWSLSIAPVRGGGEASVRIELTGHQWWWRVRYLAADGALDFETANEIHLPVGQRVEVALVSGDVLHSFWVPSLAGKLDLVPGRVNRLRLAPDQAGVFRAQCAEYCGGPHAQMAMYVIAEPPEAFERWRQRQREPAARTDALFMQHCAVCHAIRGTGAAGQLGPDLTHVGSRHSIAAGILPADASAIAHWIAHAQSIKPGNLMPAFGELPEAEVRRVAQYLAELE